MPRVGSWVVFTINCNRLKVKNSRTSKDDAPGLFASSSCLEQPSRGVLESEFSENLGKLGNTPLVGFTFSRIFSEYHICFLGNLPKLSEFLQRCIQNPVTHLRWSCGNSWQLKAVTFSHKKFNLSCLAGFWIHITAAVAVLSPLCNTFQSCTIQSIPLSCETWFCVFLVIPRTTL